MWTLYLLNVYSEIWFVAECLWSQFLEPVYYSCLTVNQMQRTSWIKGFWVRITLWNISFWLFTPGSAVKLSQLEWMYFFCAKWTLHWWGSAKGALQGDGVSCLFHYYYKLFFAASLTAEFVFQMCLLTSICLLGFIWREKRFSDVGSE